MSTTAQSLPDTSLPAGHDIRLVNLKNMPGQQYYLASGNPSKSSKLVILVHGIARNADLLIQTFQKISMDKDVILVAPVFDRERCTDYQRLGRSGKGPRADLILKAIINDAKRLTGWRGQKAAFFGHSAGAQFVHRYMFAHPQNVTCAALSAAGWYTFPTDKAYPRGIRPTHRLPDLHFEPSRFLRVPTAVFIGKDDIIRDETLNVRPALDRQQGINRLERARKWTASMQRAAKKINITTPLELFELENVGHDFEQAVWNARLHQRVLDWILEQTKGAQA